MRIFNSVLLFTILLMISGCKNGKDEKTLSATTDSLPGVLADHHSDLIYARLRYEAALKFAGHVLPDKPEELIKFRTELRKEIIEKAGILIDNDLPLNMREKGSVKMKGYEVKNIVFQTRPDVYATANLYIPDGEGPFPGVINMLGHWRKGKIDSTGPQAVGHSLALNGYVCLTVDPWGSGERTTTHGDFEYHGANLGASLMNIGESLLGVQVSDNIRGVDLLCSLPQVDDEMIGATGASGGGNQTMWLAAIDERVKASVPVVSVGTFESYIMRSNCICELLIDGLNLTEESGVLYLANAPMMINHTKDDNPTFFPAEMLRSYNNARKAFTLAGQENNINYKLFDLPHGYMREDREAMLGWFDLHLKNSGTGTPKKEIPFEMLPEEKLMVFNTGMRDMDIISTDKYCVVQGRKLKEKFLNSGTVNKDSKKAELKKILRIESIPESYRIIKNDEKKEWELITLETAERTIIPLLLLKPSGKNAGYSIICSSDGKEALSLSIIEEYKKKGEGIAIVDLTGTGELTSTASISMDYNGKLHTLSRAELWLGRTILGEWVKELGTVAEFLHSEMKAEKVSIDGTREAGLAGLFLAALDGNIESVVLRQAPVSYLFDKRDNIDFYSMGIHLPGFLVWGDVSLAAALSDGSITFIEPLTMSGGSLNEEQLRSYREEYARVHQLSGKDGRVEFK